MFVRSFSLGMLMVLAATAVAADKDGAAPNSVITFSLGGISCRFDDRYGCSRQIIPFSWLSLPQLAPICARLCASILAEEMDAEEEDQNIGEPDARHTPALRHLLAVARRCELAGDTDMASNCYREILRLQADSEVADDAQSGLRRLENRRGARHNSEIDDLQRLLRATVPLGLYYDQAKIP